MTVVKLREYFGAMAGLLEAKTVFESDMRANPFHFFSEPVYDNRKILERIGSRLVQALQYFGYDLGENRCYQAKCNRKEVLRLQNEIYKVKDRVLCGDQSVDAYIDFVKR